MYICIHIYIQTRKYYIDYGHWCIGHVIFLFVYFLFINALNMLNILIFLKYSMYS